MRHKKIELDGMLNLRMADGEVIPLLDLVLDYCDGANPLGAVTEAGQDRVEATWLEWECIGVELQARGYFMDSRPEAA